MQDRYVPGAGRFWIYLVVALPLVILVAIVIVAVNAAYDYLGIWSWNA